MRPRSGVGKVVTNIGMHSVFFLYLSLDKGLRIDILERKRSSPLCTENDLGNSNPQTKMEIWVWLLPKSGSSRVTSMIYFSLIHAWCHANSCIRAWKLNVAVERFRVRSM